MRTIVLLFTLSIISSCSTVYTNETSLFVNTITVDMSPTVINEDKEIRLPLNNGCDMFILPDEPPIPKSKSLPLALQEDPFAVNEIALDYIDGLIEYIRLHRHNLNINYKRYLESCH